MAIISLHPNNKNQYRKYPFKQNSSLRSDSGYILPDDFIVNCSITSIYGRHRIYVQQVHYKNTTGQLRITIASALEELTLGVFTGIVSDSGVSYLRLEPFVRNIAGIMTVSNIEAVVNLNTALYFEKENSELEESTIFCYTPPSVTSVRDKKNTELRGTVNFGKLINLTKTTIKAERASKLKATYPETVYNLADKSTYLGNCRTPVIKNINGVLPSTPGGVSSVNDFNIYIVGIKPIIFYGIPGEQFNTTEPGKVGIDTGYLTLDNLCTAKHKLLPPVNVCGFTLPTTEFKNKYYSKPSLDAADPELCGDAINPARRASNFFETIRPEYYYWPQFVKEEYFEYWKTT
jgi:hypothetical protein